jgi:hypothetical protein
MIVGNCILLSVCIFNCRLLGDWNEVGKSTSVLVNYSCMSHSVVVAINIATLAATAVLHSHMIDETAGNISANCVHFSHFTGVAFGQQQLSVEQMVAGESRTFTTCIDDTVRVAPALRYLLLLLFFVN